MVYYTIIFPDYVSIWKFWCPQNLLTKIKHLINNKAKCSSETLSLWHVIQGAVPMNLPISNLVALQMCSSLWPWWWLFIRRVSRSADVIPWLDAPLLLLLEDDGDSSSSSFIAQSSSRSAAEQALSSWNSFSRQVTRTSRRLRQPRSSSNLRYFFQIFSTSSSNPRSKA